MAAVPRSASFASLNAAPTSPPAADEPTAPKVRFDQECVLIPDPSPVSRLPRFVTKSYSLPLWKRKRDPSVDSEDDLPEDHVTFKVSVPSITTKARSPSRDSPHTPLVPCLVYQDPISPLPHTPRRPRRASLPVPPITTDIITVPLRACCAQCYTSIDECVKKGEHWEVRFSRGAARRRKSVSDASTPSRSRRCIRDAMPGFDAVVVDEVDQHRRRSRDMDVLTAFTVELSSADPSATSNPGAALDIPLRRVLSLPDAVHPRLTRMPSDAHPCAIPTTAPIEEEDELRPSPRRTPISTPLGSSANLWSIHAVHETTTPPTSAPVVAAPAPFPKEDSERVAFGSQSSLVSSPTSSPEIASYFPSMLRMHGRSFSESPSSSPSESPVIEHTTPSGLGSPGSARKKNLVQLPGSLFRASASMLKGISGMGGGMPLSV
ncbi:uncharacterized protein BXZ73DRAFT_90706 [Epithele typhae]|uniref:uncharacterized protein n=1 Tax=Epithele typhae TaxID=378194 RepID=UPI0020081D82|nr:uncharacterized protein BXZ73DRAFT_90706 [Epithele typhae]KAH9927423.1 hypothetical protein BXZ73DRAFT_90706 [Epithele typhae]